MKQSIPLLIGALTASIYVGCGETVDPRDHPAGSGQIAYLPGLGPPGRTASGGIDTVSYWDGDGVVGSPRIKIDLSDQKAYYYKGDELVGVSMISTGREGYNTPSGDFKIIQKNPDHRSNLYGEWVDSDGNVIDDDVDVRQKPAPPPGVRFQGASMPYFMRITGGVGMHAGFLPGFAASHGCIRMPEHMAERFFMESPQGTPVSVTH